MRVIAVVLLAVVALIAVVAVLLDADGSRGNGEDWHG